MSKYITNAKAVEYRRIDVVRWKAPHKFHYKKLVRKGIYTVFDSMILGCRYYLDENGNKVYCVNESPHEKGLRVLAECCIPVMQTPIAQQTNRVRYTVYGTQYPVSTIRYMVLSPAAHRGKSSTTAKKWREIKGLEGLWSSLQIHH